MKTQLEALEELLPVVTEYWKQREENRDYWQENGYFRNDLEHHTAAIQAVIDRLKAGESNIFPQDLKLYAPYGLL